MTRISLYLSVIVGIVFAEPCVAQENAPLIVPEALQAIALDPKFSPAERLGIDWAKATPQSTGRYIGFLAAASNLSQGIARKNDRANPSNNDYLAALAILCVWPPNKPPLVQKYWENIIPAYYDQEARAALDEAIGPRAVALPEIIEKGGDVEAILTKYSNDEEAYSAEFLDLKKLAKIK